MNNELPKAIMTGTRLFDKLRTFIVQKINWHTKDNITTPSNFSRDQKRISITISTWKMLQIASISGKLLNLTLLINYQ